MNVQLYGYVIAGHDSSATSLTWILKYVANNQHAQDVLRRHLQSVCGLACRKGRQPTAAEIVRANLPYLDAFIQESLRFAPTIPPLFRQTTVDTDIQGFPIPKDTTVFVALRGPSMTEPSVIPRDLFSKQGPADRVGSWNENDIASFKPERWLINRASATLVERLSSRRAWTMTSYDVAEELTTKPKDCFVFVHLSLLH